MRRGNRKKRKGHDCSWVWWRKKFTVEMWESLVKGKGHLDHSTVDLSRLSLAIWEEGEGKGVSGTR